MSIIVPMYNEEKVIEKTIKSLLEIAYLNFEIIIVDDGSVDSCLEICNSLFLDNPQVKILAQPNMGKAEALNTGIKHSDKDVIVCIDADTMVKPNVLVKIVPYFEDTKVAAVAGTVRVGNICNFCSKTQDYEYITCQNFERKLFGFHNGLMTIPGAIGAFRRTVIAEIGGFRNDTLTEDSEMTLKILLKGFKISNSEEAVAFTEVPLNISSFCRQRVRWKIGRAHVLLKYVQRIYRSKNKILSLMIFPYTLFYTLIFGIITPIADYLAIYHLIEGDNTFLLYYLAFLLLDASIIWYILGASKIKMPNLILIVLHRLNLRQLLFLAYIRIFIKIFNGSFFEWGNSVRYGNNEMPS